MHGTVGQALAGTDQSLVLLVLSHSLILDRGQVRGHTRQLSVLGCDRTPAQVTQHAYSRIELAAFPLLVPKLAVCAGSCRLAVQTLPPLTSGALLPGVIGGLGLGVLGLCVGKRRQRWLPSSLPSSSLPSLPGGGGCPTFRIAIFRSAIFPRCGG